MTENIRWQYAVIRQDNLLYQYDSLQDVIDYIQLHPSPKGLRAIRFNEFVIKHKLTVELDEPDPPEPDFRPDNASCTLKTKGLPYPRTCPICKLGPCHYRRKPPPSEDD